MARGMAHECAASEAGVYLPDMDLLQGLAAGSGRHCGPVTRNALMAHHAIGNTTKVLA